MFDDTIEHEAWNDSEVPRAILIFDTWHPALNRAERELIRTAVPAIKDYYRDEVSISGSESIETHAAITGALALGRFILTTSRARSRTLPAQMKPCVSLRRDAERLACFDKAVAIIEDGADGAAAFRPRICSARTATAFRRPTESGYASDEELQAN